MSDPAIFRQRLVHYVLTTPEHNMNPMILKLVSRPPSAQLEKLGVFAKLALERGLITAHDCIGSSAN